MSCSRILSFFLSRRHHFLDLRSSMMMASDGTACTCGYKYRLLDPNNGDKSDGTGMKFSSPTRLVGMDLSFVHLDGAPPPAARQHQRTQQSSVHPNEPRAFGTSLTEAGEEHGHSGFWGRYRYLRAVESVIEDGSTGAAPEDDVCLCPACILRVERAMISDAERIEQEILALDDAVREEEFRSESWKRALVQAVMGGTASFEDETRGRNGIYEGASAVELLNQQENAFRREIAILRDAVNQQESDIGRLAQLQREQGRAIQNLRQARTALEEERNNLEINARAFDSDHSLLSRELVDVQGKVDRLSSPQIRLLSTMFELTVDKDRGLRYPLINDLRLAYRPKGDVQWDEIQGAWSLAAQLLLSVATVFGFQSKNWKVVPLSHCAKLVYTEGGESPDNAGRSTTKTSAARLTAPTTKVTPTTRSMVFNLGHPRTDGSRALMAWNALLHAVIQHATVQMHKAVEGGVLESPSVLPSVPYEMSSPGQIGDSSLARINPKDDAAWSTAIHCMSSNLLWLSDCASIYVHQTTILHASAAATPALPLDS
jgi:Apg6 BARA domain